MKQIPLSQGKFALVDDEDFEYLNQFKWSYSKDKNSRTGYALRSEHVKGSCCKEKRHGAKKRLSMHREIMGLKRGDIRQVDHIDHDGLNNQRANLRVCTIAENMRNKQARLEGTSKYVGVHLLSERSVKRSYKSVSGETIIYSYIRPQTWRAAVRDNGKVKDLGLFKNEHEAALAYNAKAKELYGEFANLNVVEA